MTRELLPDNFHIRKQGMNKNRAIVKILMEFGIRVHSKETIEGSLEEYDNCFNSNMVLQIEANRLGGRGNSHLPRITLAELLTAYGKLN